MSESDLKNHEYLGDGVYAEFDGYGMWLRVGSHQSVPVIYIEPEVLNAMNLFLERMVQE